MMNKQRFERVVENMKKLELSQILVADDPSIFYLTGRIVNPMERCGAILIKYNGEVHAFMNNLFCFEPMDGMTMHYYADGENPYALIAAELKPGKVGFDKNWTAKHTISILQERDDLIPVLGSDCVDICKAHKDEEERELLRQAARVNDMAVEFGINHIDPSLDEKQLSDMIEEFFEEHGAERDIQLQYVCYGKNAAEPHHGAVAGETLKEGDAVLFDLWAPINNYWCDMTRTVFYKSVSDEHRKVYEIVKEAQQAAIDFVKPGVKMCDIDAVARKVISDAGYGDKFLTRTGHGVGMTVHEPPEASASCDLIAEPGMCFSIEPGIYLKDDVGVRIEDLVIVTEDGCEVLTKYPKDLQIVGND